MRFLPSTLLSFILMALPSTPLASPQPALVSDEYMHLMPLHTLFLRQTSDLQTFTGSLGGIAASPITNSGDSKRPFSVDGSTFDSFDSAAQRSCDNQANDCSQAANDEGNKGQFKVGDCDTQKEDCRSAQEAATVKDFNSGVASQNIGPDPQFPDFDLICDA
ncbi:hypothetical protein EJ04DRAFT_574730 [Polyplosphaeria fusca]|uniref:Uncharacterized protein n=1 Tax=Polyplosphaeria fusca TaxID=682080 RepID=A0A9P4R5S7_9PLEO|nr:hypothetical protein EJ04DRAFT_574730 [Polyplosphaeria fusca]